MRNLKSEDIFPMVTILNKIGFAEIKGMLTPEKISMLAKAFTQDSDEKDDVDITTVLGFNLIFEVATILFANLNKCKDDLYMLLADISERSVEDLENVPPAEFMQLIYDVLHKPEFGDFFKVVSKFFG